MAGTSAIQGFTLTGGRSDTESASDNRAKRGAGAFLNASGAQMTDCVVSNCVGCQGVAVCGPDGKVSNAYAFRCLFVDNRQYSSSGTEAAGGVIRFTNCGQTIAANNNGMICHSYEASGQYNCSFHTDAGASGTTINILSASATNYNCAIKLTGGASGKLNNTVVHGGVVSFAGGAVNSSSTSWQKTDPLFADAENGDLRLSAVSPARTNGSFDGPNARYHVFMGRDFYGNPLRIENGKPLCGAVHDFAPTVVTAGAGISPAGTNILKQAGETIEFTATAARPLVGFAANGETQEVANVSYTYTVPELDDYSQTLFVEAVYGTNWYVNVAADDDSGNGNAAHPKKTLAGALANAISGDAVHVAPGVYGSGVMTQSSNAFAGTTNCVVNCRASIPSGVAVVSQGSAADTFIVGDDSPSPVADMRGCGKGATRCVFMEANSRLEGFTVTGGRTDAVTGDSSDNTAGGGILAKNDTAVVADCIISNNVSQRGGGVYFGTYDRCRFLQNAVINGGNGSAAHGENGAPSSAYTVKIRNCIVADNFGWTTVYYGALDNCTLTADNRDHNGNTDGMTLLNYCRQVRNSLILGCKTMVGATGLTRCAYTAATAGRFDAAASSNDCIVAANDGELAVDPLTYAPVVGSSIAVDAGDASLYDAVAFGALDVYGNARAVNGARLDIGAVEATWLGEYSAALGRNFVSVSVASPEVELTGAGISIPAGASLVANVRGARRPRGATVSVAAGGMCDVVCDGAAAASLCAGDGQIVRIVPSADTAEVVFSASGATSVLSGFCSLAGTTVIVR